ncbi:tRNA-(ms[2]io[6]A)-hydroxylase [Legionella hackeliae]|uniref:tRNA-(Ms(2)io(6)a)-hydrolase(TRNA hydroxylase) n=1 Tax=Legionella hackeliae TaxID=449 RepID=A0A0A8UV50_LEGHA|nr:tRNA-(ms[2]io[6]A)-hydroxylase [Legionella hackeliae]KTD13920.1 tRNA hydroxylase [Legionella hackeliae]CEK10624.1 tRNA-(Ms(2)io(6)a)-hydrolase(TRNA hydroxylase) [Legionella hackeliae]STX47366.1 tRNA-(ms(2)io(6)a)-hydrolase(tRNA hydroxylase) [Legionella hackeliae]
MLSPVVSDLQILIDFLRISTPAQWLEAAIHNLPTLLIDHAHCERKAAATAINFMSKYPEHADLVAVMSPLAREELLHFEKVVEFMKQRQIDFGPLQSCNYAQKIHKYVTKGGCKERLSDQLIVGAIIEARSCERFHSLLSVLHDPQLEKFYASLVKSESRHFQDYLRLARLYGGDIDNRIDFLLQIENKLICSEDTVFRFHSGIPHEFMNA